MAGRKKKHTVNLLEFCYSRKTSVQKAAIYLLWISVASLMFLAFYAANSQLDEKSSPFTNLKLDSKDFVDSNSSTLFSQILPELEDRGTVIKTSKRNTNIKDPKKSSFEKEQLLILVDDSYSTRTEIIVALESNHFKYTIENVTDFSAILTLSVESVYSVVIFERFESYLGLESSNRHVLDSYCKEHDVGIFAISKPMKRLHYAQARGFPLYVHSGDRIQHLVINPELDILNITKVGSTIINPPGLNWTFFFSNHSTYTPIVSARVAFKDRNTTSLNVNHSYVAAVLDKGKYDNIRRIVFGYDLKFWLFELLFIDALRYLSRGKLQVPLERYLQIDIDDVLQSGTGSRVTPDDVTALLESQARIQRTIPGFRFHLGFCGRNFRRGSDLEKRADEMLIEHAQSFHWFGHTWGHVAAHTQNYTGIMRQMQRNKRFAEEQGIPVNTSYAVAPWHAGVYPVHEHLYSTWKRVWNVKVTSTEEYPRLTPAWERKGFIHKGIKVLPRQTCGLYTTNKYWSDFPEGPNRLKNSVYGGDLFFTFVYTPVMVFMTHQQNYMGDRLALYAFEEVLAFLHHWTNLRLITVPPVQLADIYFSMHPEQRDPLWTDPCRLNRHREIWAPEKSCKRLPDVVIIGPQKTGTTALRTFLKKHGRVVTSKHSPKTAEEVQFFDSRNYLKGVDWYMDFFPDREAVNISRPVYVEKGASYFSSPHAARRIKALLPNVKLIAILTDPARRAYSWFQHQRAYNLPAASDNTFNDVMTASSDAPADVIKLRDECLVAGMYVRHLRTWLRYFSNQQILILDGKQLKENPVAVMSQVQEFLKLRPYIDYSNLLKFNKRKGFYCAVVNGTQVKCLGGSIGHVYPEMDQLSSAYLRLFFQKDNLALYDLLTELQQTIPVWLDEALKS